MNILYIWHAAVEKNYRKLISKIAEKNKVTLVTASSWFESSRNQNYEYCREIDNNFKTYILFPVFKNHIRSFFYPNIFKMIYILITTKPDIIYLKEEPYSLNSFQWVFLTKIFSHKSRIVIESDENLDIKHPAIYKAIENFVLSNIDSLACVPEKGIELYKKKNFKGKIFKTFYFYNKDKFFPLKENTNNLFNFKDKICFGYAGRLTEEKGIEDILNAFSRLANEVNNTSLVLVGKGEYEYEEKLKNIVKQNNLEERVIFLGALSQEELVNFYNSIEALILASHSTEWWIEQFGRVIIECMACGTPVIGSSSGEIPIVIGDNKLIFKEKDADDLYKIMKKFATRELKKENFYNYCLERAKKFTLEEASSNKLNIMKKHIRVKN